MYFSMQQLVEKADMVMTVINSIMTIGSGDYIYMWGNMVFLILC